MDIQNNTIKYTGAAMVLRKPDTLSSQIVLYFQKEIFDGRLREGDRIPSTTLLADQFGVNPETIQTSLRRLMDRGLVKRTRGKGTFVRKGYDNKTVGIVFGQEIFADPDTLFYSIFLNELCKIIEKEGWNYKYFQRPGRLNTTGHSIISRHLPITAKYRR